MNRPATVFFLLYLGAVLYLSLYPGDFLDRPRSERLLVYTVAGRRLLLDATLNILLYVPLGASAFLALGRRGHTLTRWLLVTATGVAVSYAVERAQLFTPQRFASLADVVTNGLGTAAGAGAAAWLVSSRGAAWLRSLDVSSRWRISPDAIVFLTFWMLWQTFPFIPATNLHRFVEVWNALLHPEWPLLEMVQIAAGFLTLVWIVDRKRWLLLAYAALILQGFLAGREISLAALIAVGLAWIAGASLRVRAAWIAWALLAFLAFEEFRPFQFHSRANPFDWLPFGSWYAVGAIDYYPIVFRKLFLYTSIVWWFRASGWGWFVAAGMPLGVLAAGEWTQRHLTGRTPETTDLVLLLAGSAVLFLCHSSFDRGGSKL